jgi:hypothetical protein
VIFADLETHIDGKYSLRSKKKPQGLTVEDFINDARFQPTMLPLAENGGEPISGFIFMVFPFEGHHGRGNYIASVGLLHARLEGQPRRIGA